MRIGVIGAGKIGKLRTQSIIENQHTRVAVVGDLSEDAARTLAVKAGAPWTTDLNRFFDHEMDAVVVSSPVPAHEEACLAAFGRGLHVLCEKPLSNTVESCRRIVQAAIASRRALGVGFNLRFYPVFQFVKDTVERGVIGTMDHVRVFGGHEGLPKFAHAWEYRYPLSGGGAMMDVGIHMTDLTRFILGEITEVSGFMSESIWKIPGSEDNAVAVFRSPSGIPAIYQATWTEWRGYAISVEVYGDRGMVRGSYAPMRGLLLTQDRPGGPRRITRKNYTGLQVREKLLTWQATALESFRRELDDFIAMTEGRIGLALADGFAGQRSVEVADAVKRSTITREIIQLPPLGQMPPPGARTA